MTDTASRMEYNRDNPSPRFRYLSSLYKDMHRDGYTIQRGEAQEQLPPEKAYPGYELVKFARPIKRLIDDHKPASIIDYGSGKGMQYRWTDLTLDNGTKIQDIKSYWGIDSIRCYDPAVPDFSTLPEEPADGLVSTDVLEHCPAPDIPWIVEEMFSLARKFVFLNISCMQAMALLPDGSNAHETVRHPAWWIGLVSGIANHRPDVDYVMGMVVPTQTQSGDLRPSLQWYARPRYGEDGKPMPRAHVGF